MNDYANLTDLGKLFGLKSGGMGKLLKQLALREPDGSPSKMAIEGGFIKRIPGRQGEIEYTIWHVAKTVEKLEEAGHRRVIEAPPISSSSLIGPFSHRVTNRFVHEIRNTNGDVVLILSDQNSAEMTAKLLNLAHKHIKLC